jgi:hypothetical protein
VKKFIKYPISIGKLKSKALGLISAKLVQINTLRPIMNYISIITLKGLGRILKGIERMLGT